MDRGDDAMKATTNAAITVSTAMAATCDDAFHASGAVFGGDCGEMDLYLSLVRLQAAERALAAAAADVAGEDELEVAFGDGWSQVTVVTACPVERKIFVRSAVVRAVAVAILLACSGLMAQTPVAAGTANAGVATGTASKDAVVAEPVAKGASARRVNAVGPAAASLDEYLRRVRADNSGAQATAGAIWTDQGRLTRMSTDVRASRPHDLIQVVVEENLAASTDGTVKGSRTSSANSGISGLIGTLHAGNALQNLVNQNSASALSAQGASATNSSLSTTFGGQVVEVLPNGMLVIEAARQVEFSQQTQTIILRGLVRPEDISQQNQVLSTAISSLELQVRGKGIVNDSTHRQNVLVRLLESILVF
jgi:flagellar L-ring protein FlgH